MLDEISSGKYQHIAVKQRVEVLYQTLYSYFRGNRFYSTSGASTKFLHNFKMKNSFVRNQAEAEMDLEVGAADEAESFTTQAL